MDFHGFCEILMVCWLHLRNRSEKRLTCVDRTLSNGGAWNDIDGATYNCAWYCDIMRKRRPYDAVSETLPVKVSGGATPLRFRIPPTFSTTHVSGESLATIQTKSTPYESHRCFLL